MRWLRQNTVYEEVNKDEEHACCEDKIHKHRHTFSCFCFGLTPTQIITMSFQISFIFFLKGGFQ